MSVVLTSTPKPTTFYICNSSEKVFIFEADGRVVKASTGSTQSEDEVDGEGPSRSTSNSIVSHRGRRLAPLQDIQNNKARPTCHAVSSGQNPHVVIGYSNCDIWVVDITSWRVVTILSPSTIKAAVTHVAWLHDGSQRFVTVHEDGLLFVWHSRYEKTVEIAPIVKGVRTANHFAIDHFKGPKQHNPKSRWAIGKSGVQHVTCAADGVHMATCGSDGILRVFDFTQEKMVIAFKSYFGGLHCLCFSPDSKFVIAGGEDDMVTVWDWQEGVPIVRCVGHESWVCGVLFDPWMHSDSEVYRVVSIGQDAQMLFWDLSVDAMIRPRPRQGSATSPTSAALPTSEGVILPFPPLDKVPYIEPVAAAAVHPQPICGLALTQTHIITISKEQMKVWRRPLRSAVVDILQQRTPI
eukprot:c5258_g1_i1.p1 GENE.c5258_g1_i1~~c5258_g1_i1.p1  ORF type:complete len:459 (+),score=74.47 c5258_g1_i1:156-1379(+)